MQDRRWYYITLFTPWYCILGINADNGTKTARMSKSGWISGQYLSLQCDGSLLIVIKKAVYLNKAMQPMGSPVNKECAALPTTHDTIISYCEASTALTVSRCRLGQRFMTIIFKCSFFWFLIAYDCISYENHDRLCSTPRKLSVNGSIMWIGSENEESFCECHLTSYDRSQWIELSVAYAHFSNDRQYMVVSKYFGQYTYGRLRHAFDRITITSTFIDISLHSRKKEALVQVDYAGVDGSLVEIECYPEHDTEIGVGFSLGILCIIIIVFCVPTVITAMKRLVDKERLKAVDGWRGPRIEAALGGPYHQQRQAASGDDKDILKHATPDSDIFRSSDGIEKVVPKEDGESDQNGSSRSSQTSAAGKPGVTAPTRAAKQPSRKNKRRVSFAAARTAAVAGHRFRKATRAKKGKSAIT